MKSLITSNIEVITPEIASEYLKLNTKNRPINDRLVASLASAMANGDWQLNGEAIIFSDGNVLLDGQHRLRACIKSNLPFSTMVTRGIDISSFKTIDTGRGRTCGDILSIAGVLNGAAIAAGLSSTFRLIRNRRTGRRRTYGIDFVDAKVQRCDILEYYLEHSYICQNAFKLSASYYNKMRVLSKATILGYMVFLVAEKNHSLSDVEGFFHALYFGGYETHCIGDLRDKLIKAKTGQIFLSSDMKEALIIKTWNAYITNSDIKRVLFNPQKESYPQFV